MKTKTTLFLMLVFTGIKAQFLLQLKSAIDNGKMDSAGVAVIYRNSDSNIVLAGNESVNNLQCNFKTICSDPTGVLAWTQSFNANVKQAYTTGSTHDNLGNIYIVGCTYIDSIRLQDLTVIKYNSSGVQQWVTHYDGNGIPGGNLDVGTDIVVNNGNVYVTGTSMNNSFPPSLDYITLKLSSGGSILWTSRYDFSNDMDVPIGIAFKNNRVTVSGTTGAGSNDWDYCTISYNAISGNTISVSRQTNTVVSQDKEMAMVTDQFNNVFFTGNISNGNNEDIKIGKLDSTLTLVWDKIYDGGFTDNAYDIQLDNLGNIYVSGFSKNVNKELVLLKYSPNGTFRWKRTKLNAEGFRIKVKSDNEIYVGGNSFDSGQDVAILKYDSLGNNRIYKTYDSGSSWDWFFDFETEGDNLYVSARSKISGSYHSILLTYQERDITPSFVTTPSEQYTQDELILSFNPLIVNLQTINNKEYLFGNLSDFIPDSTLQKINIKLSSERYMCTSNKFKARKIFSDLTTADSLSTTRLGDVIKIPKFYATIAVKIPVIPGSTLKSISDSLNKIKPDIFYSGLDKAFILASPTPTPSDFQYHGQSSIHTTTYFPNAHINVDSAWTVTYGSPNVKVGIFDSGIDYFHQDLQGINYNGWDYWDNQYAYGVDDVSHGTPVAGIIGANRNNSLDIAGIAGSDNGFAGVTMLDFRISSNWLPTPTSRIIQGMNRACRATSDSLGFAINIMNQSLSTGGGSYFNNVKDIPFQEQLVFANRHAVAVSCAKGTIGAGLTFKYAHYPADWNPEIVSCVGGSGTDGHFCLPSATNCALGASDYGHNVDFVAPASGTTIISTGAALFQTSVLFGFTSASAAHVSGVYALLMSYWNYNAPDWHNLTHEDCENILRRTCTDLTSSTYSETVGYDSVSGYGRINAYRALKAINQNFYRIRHLNNSHSSSFNVSSSPYYTGPLNWPAYKNITSGVHNTSVYEITTQITFTMAPGEQIIDYWPMYKECYGWSEDTAKITIDKPYYSKIVSVSAGGGTGNATLKTYVFNTGGTYWPVNLNEAKSAITLYTYNSSGTGLTVKLKENEELNRNFKIIPNPNQGEFEVSFGSQAASSMTYRIFDVVGKEMKSGTYRSEFGVNSLKIDINNLSNGVYIVNVSDEEKILYRQKVIKN